MPYFEFIGEDASRKSERAEKYWEITQVGKSVTVRFGKIGADGQLKVKEFETKEEAEAEVAKLIKEKTKKGYVEKPSPHAQNIMVSELIFHKELESLLRESYFCDVCTSDNCEHWAAGDESLGETLVAKVNSKFTDWNLQQNQISLEDEKELFKLVMCNFDLLVCFARNLKYLSPRLKYAIISRVMYEYGSCGVPESLDAEYVELLKSNNLTFWNINHDGSYWLREKVLKDPNVGPEPLVEEFESTDSISMLTKLIRNPVFPREILIDIANGSHYALANLEDTDADELLNCAKEIIAKGK